MVNYLLEVGLMFTSIAIGGTIAVKMDKSVIPFYILTGIIIGPFGIGRISPIFVGSQEKVMGFIDIAAELGIVFLLFFLGLEFSIERFSKKRKPIIKAGSIDLINLVIGFILGLLFFDNLIAAFLTGGIIYISSSAIITKSMVDLNWIANDESEPILGILVFEDIIIAFYLAFISVIATSDEQLNNQKIILSVVYLLGFFIGLILLIYYGKMIFQKILEINAGEIILTRIMAIVTLIAGFALFVGLSEAIAAFFIGMGFASTTHHDLIEKIMAPIRDLFAAIFFFWIGLISDPTLFISVIGPVVILILITTASKIGSGFISGKVYGINDRKSLKVGLGLVPRGEFSLIIASFAISIESQFPNPDLASIIQSMTVLYVFTMSIIGTLLMQYSKFFENLLIAYQSRNTL